jgi:hypothetical protein
MARGAGERCPTIYASGRRAIDKDGWRTIEALALWRF